jgi:glycosyltransferase involved in cell wall biosynthesis
VIQPGTVGGLQEALADLAAVLTHRGWSVDLAITPEGLHLPPANGRREQLEGLAGSRWAALPRFRFLPDDVRTALHHLLLDGGLALVQTDLLRALHATLRDVHYDAVIAVTTREAPGLATFITRAHPNVLLLSLNGLPSELRLARWLRIVRAIGRLVSRGRLHTEVYRAIEPGRIRMAVFASRAWRDEALRAGLPPSAARTIYFGVPNIRPLDPPVPVTNRLLWVGRLSREKGLHQFIEAVAVLRRTRQVTLTAICGQGPADYRRSLERRIEDLGLEDIVRLRPPVHRAALQAIYRDHDALLFQSVFAEPVALVVLEAFAAGTPVVAPAPSGYSALLRPEETCVCYASDSPLDIAVTTSRLLDDLSLRDRLRRSAHALVVEQFSLEAMGAAYDDALVALLANDQGPADRASA